ncbi:MAG: hypothetical protein EHM36_12150, partial [Deltaproteobacteria bacterium]
QGMVTSFLSIGKALFIGYNRDTQWTKYWIMDLIEETLPSLFVMADILRLLQIDRDRMAKQARGEFIGATSIMEWLVRSYGVSLRKAKMVMERAVKYSEEEGAEEITFGSIRKSLQEMKIDISITSQSVEKVQQPGWVLTQTHSVGTPSEKRVREHLSSLRKRMRRDRQWLSNGKKGMERAKEWVLKMEKELIRG